MFSFHNSTVLHKDSILTDEAVNFFEAIQENQVEVVLDLLKKGVNANCLGINGITPLRLAAEKNHFHIAKLLLTFGANPNDTLEETDETELHESSRAGCEEMVSVLVYGGSDIHLTNIYDETPLHIAVRNNHQKLTSFLLMKGAAINLPDMNGKTPLHIAAEEDHEDIVETLLKFGAETDCKDNDDETPLHYACKMENRRIVESLLDAEANINIINGYNQTPLDIAITNYSIIIIHLMICHIVLRESKECKIIYKGSIAKNYDLKNTCEKEIKVMQHCYIGNSSISYYNIITKPIQQLVKFMKNEHIRAELESPNYMNFPIYETLINYRFKKGSERSRILHQCLEFLCCVIKSLPMNCIEKIADFLSMRDLIILSENL